MLRVSRPGSSEILASHGKAGPGGLWEDWGVGSKAGVKRLLMPRGLLQSPLTRTPPSCTRSPWAGCWACGSHWRMPQWRTAASGSSLAPTPVRTRLPAHRPPPATGEGPAKRSPKGPILVCRGSVQKDGPGPCRLGACNQLSGVRPRLGQQPLCAHASAAR